MKNKDNAIELKRIVEQSPVIVFLWKKQEGWPVEFVSGNVKQLLGYSAKEFLNGKINYSNLVYRDDIQKVTNEVKQFSESGNKTLKHELYRIISKAGRIIWVDDCTSIRRDNKGNITHF